MRGKTHRSDKHVAQEPRVAGPFTLVRLMKWAEFLDEITECVSVDKENLQVNGVSWAFQKQKAQLPLTNEQAFTDDTLRIFAISHPSSSNWRALLFMSGLIE